MVHSASCTGGCSSNLCMMVHTARRREASGWRQLPHCQAATRGLLGSDRHTHSRLPPPPTAASDALQPLGPDAVQQAATSDVQVHDTHLLQLLSSPGHYTYTPGGGRAHLLPGTLWQGANAVLHGWAATLTHPLGGRRPQGQVTHRPPSPPLCQQLLEALLTSSCCGCRVVHVSHSHTTTTTTTQHTPVLLHTDTHGLTTRWGCTLQATKGASWAAVAAGQEEGAALKQVPCSCCHCSQQGRARKLLPCWSPATSTNAMTPATPTLLPPAALLLPVSAEGGGSHADALQLVVRRAH
jgi:hypothetical protein